MKLNDKAYDILKWIALIAFDAIGFCYATLADIWGLPFGDAVCKTCAALAFCLGTLIGVSSVEYNKAKAIDNEQCYVQMAKEANELRETIDLADSFEDYATEEAE